MTDGIAQFLTGTPGAVGLVALIVLLLATELRTFLPRPMSRQARTGISLALTTLIVLLLGQIVVRLSG